MAYQRGGKPTCIWIKPFLFCYKKPTLDSLIVTLKFTTAEAQLIVMIRFNISQIPSFQMQSCYTPSNVQLYSSEHIK